MICQYCGGENVETEAPKVDTVRINELERGNAEWAEAQKFIVARAESAEASLAAVRAIYWQNFRGIGKSSEAKDFTDALGKALGDYKGDGNA